MDFYDAFETRAREEGLEKEAGMYNLLRAGKGTAGGAKGLLGRGVEKVRRKINPTRGERLVDYAKDQAGRVGSKFDEAFPTRGMTMRRKAKDVGKAGLGLAGSAAVAGGKAAITGAKALGSAAKKDLSKGYVARALSRKPPTAMAKTKKALKDLPAKVKNNWNNMTKTQKTLALGIPAATVGGAIGYSASRD